jgi:hypothetical protein
MLNQEIALNTLLEIPFCGVWISYKFLLHANFNEFFIILIFIFVDQYINNNYELFLEPTRDFS